MQRMACLALEAPWNSAQVDTSNRPGAPWVETRPPLDSLEMPLRAVLHLRLPATADAVAQARKAACAYGEASGAEPDRLAEIALAISEAVTNAVRHAYRDGEEGEVQVTGVAFDAEIEFVVRDFGIGYRALTPRSDGLRIGLPLIGCLADRLSVLSASPGTQVVMAFRRDGTAHA